MCQSPSPLWGGSGRGYIQFPSEGRGGGYIQFLPRPCWEGRGGGLNVSVSLPPVGRVGEGVSGVLLTEFACIRPHVLTLNELDSSETK